VTTDTGTLLPISGSKVSEQGDVHVVEVPPPRNAIVWLPLLLVPFFLAIAVPLALQTTGEPLVAWFVVAVGVAAFVRSLQVITTRTRVTVTSQSVMLADRSLLWRRSCSCARRDFSVGDFISGTGRNSQAYRRLYFGKKTVRAFYGWREEALWDVMALIEKWSAVPSDERAPVERDKVVHGDHETYVLELGPPRKNWLLWFVFPFILFFELAAFGTFRHIPLHLTEIVIIATFVVAGIGFTLAAANLLMTRTRVDIAPRAVRYQTTGLFGTRVITCAPDQVVLRDVIRAGQRLDDRVASFTRHRSGPPVSYLPIELRGRAVRAFQGWSVPEIDSARSTLEQWLGIARERAAAGERLMD
jgi:hypothetical protein